MKATGMLLIGLLAVCLAQGAIAQEDPFEKLSREFDQWRGNDLRLFDDYVAEVTAEYEAFARAESLAYAKFEAEVAQIWGSYTPPQKQDWVEYSQDKEARTKVDFETGEAKVEILVEPEVAQSDAAMQQLEAAVQKLVTDRGKTMDYEVQDERPQPLSDEPVLKGQVVDSRGETVTEQNAGQFAREVVQSQPVERTELESKDGVQRVKVAVTIKLVPRHLRVRAEKYAETVQAFSQKYDLDSQIVFALMHTESYFNPKARSPVPAYGLMQLVPSSGGRDAYKFVHDEDKVVSPNLLYDPQQNVELGCAYLHLIMTRYFKRVIDGRSRLYCSICAYNTGAGNVSKAFTGERKIIAASKVINQMTPDEVLQKLIADLPYDETKQYIQKILDRKKYYQEWKI